MPSPGEVLTYQDPCRLGRRSGIYDSPRRLLKAVPGAEVLEMERTRDNALCCGTSAWMECTSCSKAIQSERLMEAEETGASRLITSCPKCQIHFTCAQSREDFKIGVTDIYTYLLERLGGKNENSSGL
jgi:Fe-S oxidoreductase